MATMGSIGFQRVQGTITLPCASHDAQRLRYPVSQRSVCSYHNPRLSACSNLHSAVRKQIAAGFFHAFGTSSVVKYVYTWRQASKERKGGWVRELGELGIGVLLHTSRCSATMSEIGWVRRYSCV
jgi:hypothetical protein